MAGETPPFEDTMAVILFKMDKDKGLIEERFDSSDINIATHEKIGWCVTPERAREVYEINKPVPTPEPEKISTIPFSKPKAKPGPKPKIKVEDNAGQSEI
jgi:hypothetical protein